MARGGQMINFETLRKNMVNSQLLPNAITSAELLEAFSTLKREDFVPDNQKANAYIDRDLTLNVKTETGIKRFLLEPMIQAKLIQAANIEPNDIVLDVACASGYSTAIIAKLANMVVGVEADKNVAQLASENLETYGINNAVIVHDALNDGYKKEAPYDVIILNGLVEQIPQMLFDQLAENGRLIAVEAADSSSINAHLGHAFLYHKTNGNIGKRMLFDACSIRLSDFDKITEFML